MPRELREVQLNDRLVQVDVNDADVATLLLQLTETANVVSRATLRETWSIIAPELNRSRPSNPAKVESDDGQGRGNFASHVLGNTLRILEKFGYVRRVGEGSALAVVVLDRAGLEAIAESWD